MYIVGKQSSDYDDHAVKWRTIGGGNMEAGEGYSIFDRIFRPKLDGVSIHPNVAKEQQRKNGKLI